MPAQNETRYCPRLPLPHVPAPQQASSAFSSRACTKGGSEARWTLAFSIPAVMPHTEREIENTVRRDDPTAPLSRKMKVKFTGLTQNLDQL